MNRSAQLTSVEAARPEILAWATREQIPLHRVEYVAPIAEDDLVLSVWLFYDTDLSLATCRGDGTSDRLQRQVLAILAGLGYPAEALALVRFFDDSHENVERTYEGSYFYRLR